jgi:hypothetical protein
MSSPNILWQIKSRRMRYVACMGEKSVPRFLWESLNERDHLEDRGIDERVVSVDVGEIGWGCVEGIQLA